MSEKTKQTSPELPSPDRPYPRFYVTEGSPARIQTKTSVPEIYVGRGKWQPYADLEDLVANGVPVDNDGLLDAIRRFDSR